MPPIQREVEELIDGCEPGVEVLLAEVVGAATLRVFIDHPGGVTLDLCEQVSALLSPLRERYALEVSSPGTRRPLTKPDHFRRFVGHRARVRTRSALCPQDARADGEPGAESPRARRTRGGSPAREAGTHTVTGELLGATEREVTLAVGEGVIAIPYSDIRRSNLMEG
ncbi:MAG: ribosome maturation factor RimP [Acidobacteriota bacterium]|nr:ribosome maturation factor RimP [Acidobacteriota bacterium]